MLSPASSCPVQALLPEAAPNFGSSDTTSTSTAHTTSIHPCDPLLFPESLPCSTFLDKSSIFPTVQQDSMECNRVLQPEEVLGSLPETRFRSVMGIMGQDQSSDT